MNNFRTVGIKVISIGFIFTLGLFSWLPICKAAVNLSLYHSESQPHENLKKRLTLEETKYSFYVSIGSKDPPCGGILITDEFVVTVNYCADKNVLQVRNIFGEVQEGKKMGGSPVVGGQEENTIFLIKLQEKFSDSLCFGTLAKTVWKEDKSETCEYVEYQSGKDGIVNVKYSKTSFERNEKTCGCMRENERGDVICSTRKGLSAPCSAGSAIVCNEVVRGLMITNVKYKLSCGVRYDGTGKECNNKQLDVFFANIGSHYKWLVENTNGKLERAENEPDIRIYKDSEPTVLPVLKYVMLKGFIVSSVYVLKFPSTTLGAILLSTTITSPFGIIITIACTLCYVVITLWFF